MRPARAVLLLVAAASLSACSASSTAPAARHAASSSPRSSQAPSQAPSSAPSSAPVTQASGPPALHVRTVRWRLPGRLSREVAMGYAGGLLVAGGLQPGDVSSDRVWRIDPGTGARTRLGTLADAVHDAAGGVLQGRPTVLGGGASSSLSVVQQGSVRWRVASHLPGPRSDLSATSVGNGLVVVGGYDGVQSPRTVLETTDGRHFHVVARLPQGVRYAGVAAMHGQVWVLGGEENGRELREVYRVDPATGRVARAGRLPGPLGHEAVVAVGDRLLVLGGRPATDTATDRMWWFNPSTGSWRRAGRLPYPVADAPAVTAGGATYLLGGETPSFTSRVMRLRWSR